MNLPFGNDLYHHMVMFRGWEKMSLPQILMTNPGHRAKESGFIPTPHSSSLVPTYMLQYLLILLIFSKVYASWPTVYHWTNLPVANVWIPCMFFGCLDIFKSLSTLIDGKRSCIHLRSVHSSSPFISSVLLESSLQESKSLHPMIQSHFCLHPKLLHRPAHVYPIYD